MLPCLNHGLACATQPLLGLMLGMKDLIRVMEHCLGPAARSGSQMDAEEQQHMDREDFLVVSEEGSRDRFMLHAWKLCFVIQAASRKAK